MKRINAILDHSEYKRNLDKNIKIEKDRVFCRHNLQHFLDVARVGYIIALEKKLEISKEMIYAAALLHDIGKWRQYSEGMDHAIASADIAEDILQDCCFQEEERKTIVEAIKKHRRGENLVTELDKVLYEGDKLSRLCIECSSRKDCKRFGGEEKPILLY